MSNFSKLIFNKVQGRKDSMHVRGAGTLLGQETQAKFITPVPLSGADAEGILVLNFHTHFNQKA